MSGASQGPLVGGPAQAFATGQLQTVVATLQNLVVQIGTLTKQIATSTGSIFPQTQGTAATATQRVSRHCQPRPLALSEVQLRQWVAWSTESPITAPQTVKVAFYLT